MRVVFLLCVCSARSEGQVAIGYVSSAAAAPARRGEFIKEEEATTADVFKSLFRIRSSGQADAKLSIEPISGLRRRLAPPPLGLRVHRFSNF